MEDEVTLWVIPGFIVKHNVNYLFKKTCKLLPIFHLSKEIVSGIILLFWHQQSSIYLFPSCHYNYMIAYNNIEVVRRHQVVIAWIRLRETKKLREPKPGLQLTSVNSVMNCFCSTIFDKTILAVFTFYTCRLHKFLLKTLCRLPFRKGYLNHRFYVYTSSAGSSSFRNLL